MFSLCASQKTCLKDVPECACDIWVLVHAYLCGKTAAQPNGLRGFF